MSKCVAPLLNEGNMLSSGDDLSGGLIEKPNPDLVSRLLPPQEHY